MENLFQLAENTQAYFKCGMFGFEGSGKTYSMSLFAIGLHKFIKSKKGVYFFDTETGSAFVKPLFDAAKIKLYTIHSHSIKTLAEAIKEAMKSTDILLADSLTHVYKDLCSSYVNSKKDGSKFIRMQDWSIIKETWARCFATPYVNSNMHFLWSARAKNIFEDVLDEETSDGKALFKPIQVGVGARSETESAYEPSLLIEMERIHKTNEKSSTRNNKAKKSQKTGVYHRRATVIKDRFNTIDGHQEINPTFDFILPHIKLLNLGGTHVGFKQEDSNALFEDDNRYNVPRERKRRKVALEKVTNTLFEIYPGNHEKGRRTILMRKVTGDSSISWEELEIRHPDDLEKYVDILVKLRDEFKTGFIFEKESDLDAKIKGIRVGLSQKETTKELFE